MEMGNGLTPDHSHSSPADVLVARWEKGLSGAMDITFQLYPAILEESFSVSWGLCRCCRGLQTCC